MSVRGAEHRADHLDRVPIDIIDGLPPGDLLLVCSDGQSIRVHSQIIMLASSVLRQTLSSTLKVRFQSDIKRSAPDLIWQETQTTNQVLTAAAATYRTLS